MWLWSKITPLSQYFLAFLTMGQKALSSDLCAVLVHMSHKRNLPVKEIERLTSVKICTIQKILKWYNDTGTVAPLKKRTIHDGAISNEYFEVCLVHLQLLLN